MKEKKRKVEVVVISDIHLGTYGCHAKELLHYLKSIKPGIVVLNGDIVDVWQFSKTYWPGSHMKVVKHLMKWIGNGTKTYYVTGNHDEMLRRFVGMKMGALSIVNKVVLNLDDGKKAWIFHGDVFDVTMQYSRWLAKLGSKGYDILILINRFVNFISQKILKRGKLSLSKKIKQSVKSAVAFINNFEQTSAEIGIQNKYDYVICGHIHHPEIKTITTEAGSITYMNSGDWVENLSSLEYTDGEWSIYQFSKFDNEKMKMESKEEEKDMDNAKIFNNMLLEFNLHHQ
ncbi:MAG: UDP-2,3-diacylglucosamine hydrolase [Bacteroidetes bacterium HGW-Bacteroidetes-11]|jgi:UDP-2,3-diacylglucosamine pyrophosphatase LpxH|nr:MAG: UDP-2,3-diacylglucosamine hydrolase [Bacteroidetes bacterium HGW-Bacteroidetes-11]